MNRPDSGPVEPTVVYPSAISHATVGGRVVEARADYLAALAELDPEEWSADALGVSEGDERQLGRVGGRRLAEAISKALDGTGRTLAAREWTAGERGRGYFLSDVRTAAGLAPE